MVLFVKKMTQETLSKVVLIGDSGVGKTSLIYFMSTSTFNEASIPTLGAALTKITFETFSGSISFQLWDTAGQEQFRSLVPVYYKGAVAAIIVFSLTDLQTFIHVDGWIEQLKLHADPDIKMLVVGNKLDDDIKLNPDSIHEWAATRNIQVLLVSAKTGENIEDLKDYMVSHFKKPPEREKPVPLDATTEEKSTCC